MATGGNHVFIIGPRRIQNELIASYVSGQTHVSCIVVGTVEEAREASNGASPARTLLLTDFPTPQGNGIRHELLRNAGSVPGAVLALFNVPPGQQVERDAVPLGFRGFFYAGERPEVLLKGIRALLQGELWMSRKIMSDCLIYGRVDAPAAPEPEFTLTKRELEVLASVAAGASNEVIASRLFISPHTVKTHVYRIFRKVGVSSRLEAALWAAKNI